MIDRNDLRWYRDAIIYQLHVKSFFDANGDGIGDFAGLTQKLGYIKDLGATAVWLMPFYPSPLRDDGYDISSYRGINPAYGSLRDFKHFVRNAHECGLRVITELVINHTSDQHPWFQRARAAKPGSAARNFYVWSSTDRAYAEAPVIFVDTEKSNWTWDDQAKAFYWHRFYAHQPDLNFDNPRVLGEILGVMAYWLDMGVDGMRLDAIPYLIEREGTTCENLPETHAIIKKMRALIDARFPDRMLLAEANLWPEETAQYFGDGDECHMAFHFPLMPRIYMALAQEDRHPVTDIMRQTPEIPDGAQWAIFLRNHDEMTLAMVTSKERDYLWSFYAADPRARINLGIRRRLAPLLENDRRKIELLNSLLFSLPGTPVIYYGDEIGMGDNIYLGDRDGVRTPMQWSPDRNGGFSRADPARLSLPPIQDPVYGFSAVNVEAQLASPSSLLTWMRRMIAVRRSHLSFGRGTLRFLYPSNRKVLAYLREYEDERILCVANVSRAPQAVELDLTEFKGCVPVELTAGSVFPPAGSRPYLLTLPSYGFFWFRIEAETEKHRLEPHEVPGLFTLVATGKLETILTGRELVAFERTVMPRFLASRHWFPQQEAKALSVTVRDFCVLRDGGEGRFVLPLLDVAIENGSSGTYFVPLAAETEKEEEPSLVHAAARLRRGSLSGLLYEAEACDGFAHAVMAALRRGERLATDRGGEFVFSSTPLLSSEPPAELRDIRHLATSRNNFLIVIANQMLLKVRRLLQEGDDPEIEMLRFLTSAAHFANAPALLGAVVHVDRAKKRTFLANVQTYVRNQGDAWTWTVESLKRSLEAAALAPGQGSRAGHDEFAASAPHMRRLGFRTAAMHKALATPAGDPAFEPEPLALDDVSDTAQAAKGQCGRAFECLRSIVPFLSAEKRGEALRLLEREDECLKLIDALVREPRGAIKTRIHGDYHLGRLLVVKDDVVITGFGQGPSMLPLKARAKTSPLYDVAVMVRSLVHAVAAAKQDLIRLVPDPESAAVRLRNELIEFSQVFIRAYMEEARGSPVFIEDEDTRRRLLVLYILAEMLGDIERAASSRPEWADMSVDSVNAILDRMARR
ncbi:MAG TPA: maltose alpha-D-glucosyltransferase [Methylocella sp.]|nr:maltose alpha-D-glucosyltransferase [Methylocella sp.]